jgi:hypothetical protein
MRATIEKQWGDSALVLHSVGRHMSRSEVFSSLLASRFRIAIEAARGDSSLTAPNPLCGAS